MMPHFRTRFWLAASLVLGVLPLLGGCSRSPQLKDTSSAASGEAPIVAVATVGMVADMVREIGGTRVEVIQIMGPGVDPHLYKTTRDDVREIMRGDLIFYSGLMLEGKMSDTLEKIGQTKPVYAVTEQIDPAYLLEPEDFAGHYDPHVWMDVSAWAQCVGVVAKALSEHDPEHAEAYAAAAAAYAAELDELHRYGVERIASIPPERRLLITSHDAFNYFGRAYQLDVVGVQGLSTDSEAGLQQINRLVDLIVEREVQAVFVESSVPQKNIRSLIDGARSRGHNVVIGSELYSDAMGPNGTYEGTYIGMLDHNITRVTRALGGEAPERGLRGQLRSGELRPAEGEE